MPSDQAFFRAQPGETTMISYEGKAPSLPNSIYSELEEKLNDTDDLKSRKKRFYYIAVECMQNIIRHQDDLNQHTKPFQVMAFADPGNHYRIATGNTLSSTNARQLRKQLDQLSSLTSEELHEQYLRKLSENTLSEKGGAGLGLIEIARKSENNIRYNFNEEGQNCFFSLEVTVK
jgi:ABC-type Fe3+ transport system substrate-binding protein